MRASNQHLVALALAALAIVGYSIVPIAFGQSVVIIKPNVQVSSPLGPDQAVGGDEDDPKAQVEPVIATSPTTPGLLYVGCTDGSFSLSYDPYDPPDTRDWRIGFMASTEWGFAASWRHDISANRGNQSIDLPEPDACTGFIGWKRLHQNASVAIGGNGYVYLAAALSNNLYAAEEASIYFARQPESAIGNPQWAGNSVPGSCHQLLSARYPTIAADRSGDPNRMGRVYLIWEQSTAYGNAQDVRFAYSQSGGSDFLDGTSASPIVLAETTQEEGPVVAPTVAVGPNGEVHALWTRTRTYDDNFPWLNGRFELRTSSNGGVSFGATTYLPFTFNDVEGDETAQAFTRMYINSYPSMAVDVTACGTGGTIYVAFTAGTDEYDHDSDILLTRSTDGGQTWTPPVNLVHENEATYGPFQFFPAVAVDDFGRVVVIWLDDRESGDLHDEYAVYMNYSTDGGETWQLQNDRVMDAGESSPTYWELAQGYPLDLGVRIGMAARGDTFYGVWSDLRHWTDPDPGFEDLWDEGDVFLGRVRLPVADFDYDRDIDTSDFALFSQCFGGANNPPAPTCPFGVDADLDGDADVDTADFAIFGQFFAPGATWCSVPPASQGEGMGAGVGEDAEAGYPTLDELYEQLRAYCLEHDIPFT